MPYTWDDTAKRYRDGSGKFVPRSTVFGYSGDSIKAGADAIAELAGKNLPPADWEKGMRGEIKREYIRQYLLGHGGRAGMTHADWGRIGAMVKEQYKYLAGFAQEIAAGNLTEAQIAARSAMYLNSAREALEKARALMAAAWGADEEKWNLGAVKTEHCEDCLDYAGGGWQKIGYYPMPGQGHTRCLTNCHCFKEYRSREGAEGVDFELWNG